MGSDLVEKPFKDADPHEQRKRKHKYLIKQRHSFFLDLIYYRIKKQRCFSYMVNVNSLYQIFDLHPNFPFDQILIFLMSRTQPNFSVVNNAARVNGEL